MAAKILAAMNMTDFPKIRHILAAIILSPKVVMGKFGELNMVFLQINCANLDIPI